MGTPDFAVPSLRILMNEGFPVVGVVTGPDKPRGRGRVVSPTPVKEVAAAAGLPVLQPEILTDPLFEKQVRALDPDLIVIVAFRILPASIFTLPRLGSFNLHASLLPRYRGAAPINWAIINGDTETGVTTFFLEDRVDTGNIIMQERTPIGPEDDAGELHDRLALLGARVVLSTALAIEGGKAVTTSQDPALVSKAPKIFKEDCHIRWDQPPERARNFIRGLSPSPTAWTRHGEVLLKIFKTEQFDNLIDVPGTASVIQDALVVQCKEGRLKILELQQEGKKRMSAGEFLRGYRFPDGDLLQ
ncbi:MAG: methionyl-tRNA formyltransferase [Bacteroidota bacterium]